MKESQDTRAGYKRCMVLSYMAAAIEGSFFSMVYGYGMTNDGNVGRAGTLAAYGGGGPIANDSGVL